MAFLRIFVLMWADVLTTYSMFVLSTYLTDVWDLSIAHASGIVNIWFGIALTTQSGLLHLAETVFGHFSILLSSSIAYCIGLGFLCMSTPPFLSNATGTCSNYKPECIGPVQKALFYTSLPLMAFGMSGHAVSIVQFLADQYPEFNQLDYSRRPFKIVGFLGIFIGPLVGAFALPYIKPWSINFGIPAILVLVATLFFLSGSFSYKINGPQGSPLTTVARVIVASTRNITRKLPADHTDLYEIVTRNAMYLPHTRGLRCLDKAAIQSPSQEQENYRWKICRVSEVEETKLIIRILPMLLVFIGLGIVSSIGKTYFVVQADNMNPKIGKWKVPLQVFQLIIDVTTDKIFNDMVLQFKQFLKRMGLNKYALPLNVTVAVVFSVLCCITAAKVEARRLHVIRAHDLFNNPDERIPMSMFWLVPQYMLLAGMDSFITSSIVVCLAPLMTTALASHFLFLTNGMFGLGYMGNVLSVYVVGKASEKNGNQNWFQHTLNRSRLDKYYWTLAALSSVSFVLLSLAAMMYPYKSTLFDDADTGNVEEVSSCCCWERKRIVEPHRQYYEEGWYCCCFYTKHFSEVSYTRDNVILQFP
ncbi:hypothetical protein OROGR_018481 [Orobanche gracilis]